jgi:hypothetical protein
MKYTTGFLVFSVIAAVAYGVIFSMVYPLVQIDGNMISLFALLGVATTLICIGVWRAVIRK